MPKCAFSLVNVVKSTKTLTKNSVFFTTTVLNIQQSSYMQLSHKLYEEMREWASIGSIPIARKLHGQLISSGIGSSIFLQNHLLNLYFNCNLTNDACRVFVDIKCRNVFSYNTMISGLADSGLIEEARKLFEEMPKRDTVSWNSIMSGYFCNGKPEEAIKVFTSMVQDCECIVSRLSLSCAMKACGALGYLKLAFQLHGIAEKYYLGSDLTIQASVMDMYIKCGVVNYAEQVFLTISNPSLFCFNSMIYGYSKSYGVGRALDLFNQMPEHDDISWNTMISILSRHGFGVQTLTMFVEMWNEGFRPNSMTYATVLSACTSIFYMDWGAHLHARIVRMEPCLDAYVGSGLIDMYAKCGCLEFARRVFDRLTEQNAVSWTSLIGGVAQCGLEVEALLLFCQMRNVPVGLDEFTLATVLGVCSSPNFISVGRQLHALTIKSGMGSSVPVGNAVGTMYSKCGDTQNANYAFEMMPVKDIISWTAMITTFSQIGDVKKAQACFDKMQERNVITWNSMISMYIQHGLWQRSVKMFAQMRRERTMPDHITFTSSISACADLAILKLGMQIVAQAEKLGFGFDVSVANSVITMYSGCGQVEEARKVFDSICRKDLVSWNAMMAGYAHNGQGRKAIEIFENMLKLGYAPDHISYLSVLSGCSHSGLITQGRNYFQSMTRDYGISPTCVHFACMVDLFGRAGLLEEAKNLIEEMPFKPNGAVWRAFLGACRIHCNTKLADFAVRNLFELDMGSSVGYILLANIHSDSGNLEGVADLRKLIREKGIQKNPGCSWLEVNSRVNVFTAGETNHPQIKDIYSMLEVIIKKIEDIRNYADAVGFVGDWKHHNEKLLVE